MGTVSKTALAIVVDQRDRVRGRERGIVLFAHCCRRSLQNCASDCGRLARSGN